VPSSSVSPPPSPHQSLKPPLALSQPPLKNRARRGAAEASMLDHKRRTAWRTGLTVITLPLLLALAALLTRFTSRPLFLGLLAGLSPGTRVHLATGTDRAVYSAHAHTHALHRRQTGASTMPSEPSTSGAAGIVFPTPSKTSNSTPPPPPPPPEPVPTIPSEPPVLPTPFPQPFDTTLGTNFTTNSCENFFLNMTQSLPFRECRPFSFLSQTSTSFLQAQSNITALNVDIWGTCNTPVDADQCAANMGWFESELLSACSEEKSQGNVLISQSLAGLQSYTLMRQVACLPDQNTSTYCYVEATSNQNPSDLYFYSLPSGIPLPNNTNLSCSSCTKNVMALFGAQLNQTGGLEKTYNNAAILASSKCGSDYVYTHSAIASSSALPWVGDKPPSVWTVVFTLGAVLMGLV
jgi:hypothetical protein